MKLDDVTIGALRRSKERIHRRAQKAESDRKLLLDASLLILSSIDQIDAARTLPIAFVTENLRKVVLKVSPDGVEEVGGVQ